MRISSLSPSFVCVFCLAAQEQPARKSHIDDLISGARAAVAQKNPRAEAYNDLASALVRRAREKSDPAYLRQAEEAVNQSLRVMPANFEARKIRVMIRLREGRYSDALEEAQALNKQMPDDNLMYGLVCDAQLALGNYKEAEASAQRMIDLRQVSAPGLQRGAKIRESIGYVDGAIDWWGSSLRLTSATDEEERAFILIRIARLNRETGKAEAAAKYAGEALALVPSYPSGLTELALDRLEEDKPAEGVELLRQRLAVSKDLESLYWLAEALKRAGSSAEGDQTAAAFEKQALAVSTQPGEVNSLLVVYEAEHGNAALALRIARESAARRHDAYTLDAYAWALYASGDAAAAGKQEALALETGVRSAVLYFHAGMIARKNGDLAAAGKFFKKSLETNAGSAEAPRVIQELAAVSGPSPG